MHRHQHVSARAAIVMAGLALCGTTLACAPPTVAVPTPVPPDPFAVVRATAQAAYVSGQAHLDSGELQQALIDLDTAKTNDPDSRADIERALSQTISQLALQTPTAEPTVLPRSIVVATRGVGAATPGAGTGPAAATAGPIPAPATALATPGASLPTTPISATPTRATLAAPTSAETVQPSAAAALVAWRDPQGRFTLSAPGSWTRASEPLSLIGTSVVQFQDPSARAEVDVAVDPATRAVSPELYAATVELAMQRQVPGYAAEQTLPGTTAGNPSVRRVYTFTQRDAAGNDSQARGFQVAVVKGSTPYLITGSAPANQFADFGATFDQMVETFRFS